jgi:Holliday junction resolvasome RuvABC endonuclease subunit
MYLGLDCSSKAVHGIVIDDSEKIVFQLKSEGKGSDFDTRFSEIFMNFSEDLSKIDIISGAAIEAAIYIQNPRTTLAIAYVVGGVRVVLQEHSIPHALVDNRSWKKDVVGRGNVKKVDIKNFAIEKWGDVFKEQDFADAACIALWYKRRRQDGTTEN